MSDSASRVFMHEDDPAMRRACEQARNTFRYFWREMAWERRRIIPGLGLAVVKAPFSDGPHASPNNGHPQVEQMWIGEVNFDGRVVSGRLMNAPNWLKTVKQGDPASFPIAEISDWMYVTDGRAYGAYTVNLLRSRMGASERQEHDSAWGIDFGDPSKIRLVPQAKGWFAKKVSEDEEHPMSVNMVPSLVKQIAANPAFVRDTDDNGWTLLHDEALAGSLPTVTVLLKHGADPNSRTKDGLTPLKLAQSLGWYRVIELLKSHGAKD